MRRVVLSAAIALALASCGNEGMETEVSPNGAEAKLIAVVDGCRVWRISDFRSVYFARCPEGAAGAEYDYRVGKVTHTQTTIGDAR